MKKTSLFDQFVHSSTTIKIATMAVVIVWGMVLVALIGFAVVFLERPVVALQPTPNAAVPDIVLDPTTAQSGTTVMVRGEGWNAGSTVFIYVTAPGEMGTPSYAMSSAVADTDGRFTTGFVVPSGPGWENQGMATVTAQVAGGDVSARTFLSITSSQQQPVATTEVPVEPTASVPESPTETPTVLIPATPTPTPRPEKATGTATTDLNIRSGPGITHAVLGVLLAGQAAQITGISPDGGWWRIQFSGTADEVGWVSAKYVVAENTGNVPVVQAPAPPATATPAPTPTPLPVITDWRGEYYANRDLAGSPTLVRNDVAINFDWGTGSPAAGLPADNFSSRWTRTWTISQRGLYRFHIVADDGVRLWVDDKLVFDQWWDGGHQGTADYRLDDGTHSLRLEYYERTGDARILSWAEQVSEAPEADFDASPRSGPAPLRVEFDNNSNGDYDSCKWDFGDGNTSDDCDDPSHTYREAGEYTVKFKVSGPGGEDSQKRNEYITVYEPAQAHFGASPTHGVAPLTVKFTNRSSGIYDTCNWSLGDGATHTGCGAFSHTYETEGDYTVALTVSGSGGSDTRTKTNHITVTARPPVDQPPTAVINGPTQGLVGEVLTFNGSSSNDSDGTILSYTWDFGDGATSSGVNVNHSYSLTGSYNVILTVTDNGGLSDTSTYTLLIQESVTNRSPVAVINGPASALVGETVIFDSGGSHDPDGTIVSYAWDFGDGVASASAQSGASTLAHSYSAPGSYQVTLTVTDDGGLSDTATHTIVVREPTSNQPPIAEINGPASAVVGETVIFDSGGSHDPDGTIVSYVWDFGDGGASALAESAQSGNSTMAHSYSTPGPYQVRLTVTDDGGLSDTATHMIVIEAPVVNQVPTAVINGPTQGLVGELLTFDGSSSSDPDGTILGYAWDFGDGATGKGVNVGHSYTRVGSYNVILTVTDDGGLSDTSAYTLLIQEGRPITSRKAPSPTPTNKPTPTATATLVSPTDTPAPVPPTPTPEPATATRRNHRPPRQPLSRLAQPRSPGAAGDDK